MTQTSVQIIQTIEEISRAWSSLQEILYDGWILRVANSYTKRANTINSLYTASKNVYEKIARAEQIYIDKLKPIFTNNTSCSS